MAERSPSKKGLKSPKTSSPKQKLAVAGPSSPQEGVTLDRISSSIEGLAVAGPSTSKGLKVAGTSPSKQSRAMTRPPSAKGSKNVAKSILSKVYKAVARPSTTRDPVDVTRRSFSYEALVSVVGLSAPPLNIAVLLGSPTSSEENLVLSKSFSSDENDVSVGSDKELSVTELVEKESSTGTCSLSSKETVILVSAYTIHVDASAITTAANNATPDKPRGKKAPLKTFEELQTLLQQNRKRELKILIRDNSWPINSSVRTSLWPALCRQHQHGKSMLDGFYWDMVTQVFGTVELPDKPIMLPPFVEATHCLGYHLTRKGRAVADRVVSVVGFACPDITYSPSLYPITAALLHFMPEEECYHCMASLVASKEKMFITQTKLLNEVTWKTVMQIAKKHAKSAAQHLSRLSGAIGPERIYTDWQWWILAALPFPHLVRVLDCFFHEGIKVFYRVALAILILFHKHSTNQSSEWYAEATKNGVDHAIDKFCRNMPASPTKLLRTAFSIRALSSQYISRVFIKTEMTLKSKQVITGSRLVRSRSSDNLPTSQSQVNIQMMSHTLTIREGSHSPGPRALSMGVYPIQALKSQILDQSELFTLWSWLPVRITMYQPVLLYTTEEHGCSLTTFYVRVEHHEPTLLMIKTCNNEVFGAYCSTRWFERNQKDERGNRQAYFGTGETFLFSLYPERAKYPWVGCSTGAGDKPEDQRLAHGSELFMAADTKMITIGGGDGQAIWMDENIRFGKTDRCSTFNNPPLCPSGDFEIRVLEVYGFSGA